MMNVMDILRKILIAPSILAADYAHLAEAVRIIERGKGDWVHLDIMDGKFVPNITFGPKMVSTLRGYTKLPFDVHLMITKPENFIHKFAEAGSDIITIHYESSVHIHRHLNKIRELGKKAGISIVPSTPVTVLSEILPIIDLVLIMTVNPGFGGQTLIEQTLNKVEFLTSIKQEKNYAFFIEVDGGINRENCKRVIGAGAEVLVVGSAIFEAANPEEEIQLLKGGE